MTVYGVFGPAARPVTDVYGHRNASPGKEQDARDIVEMLVESLVLKVSSL